MKMQLRCSEKSKRRWGNLGLFLQKTDRFACPTYVDGGNWAATEKQKYENNGRKRDRKKYLKTELSPVQIKSTISLIYYRGNQSK